MVLPTLELSPVDEKGNSEDFLNMNSKDLPVICKNVYAGLMNPQKY